MVGGVGDDQVAVVAEPVGEEVVEDAAVVLAEAGVLGAADLDLGDVVGEHVLEEGERARPLDLDLAHVRDVEHAGVRAHRQVLLPHPLVLHRHLPAGERHQPPALQLMLLVERGPAEGSLTR